MIILCFVYVKGMDQNSQVDNSDLKAMVASFETIDLSKVTLGNLGTLTDGRTLRSPLYHGSKMVLDLTPKEDDWLHILGVNPDPAKHHEGEDVEALPIAVKVADMDATILDKIDEILMASYEYSAMRSKIPWYHMNKGKGKVVVNLALGNSAAPTHLLFLKGNKFVKGTGYEFLQTNLDGASLKDYLCKAVVELECLHEAADYIGVVITVHSAMFVPQPTRALVMYSRDEEETAIRAAKRLKYRF